MQRRAERRRRGRKRRVGGGGVRGRAGGVWRIFPQLLVITFLQEI